MAFKLIGNEERCMPALIHNHERKRIHQNLEPYPHPDKWKNLVDKLIYPVALFGIAFTIPQVITIWIENNTEGVSIISWSAYLMVASFWFLYGVLHKEKPIMLIYLMWILVEVMIVIGLLVKG
jgi:uncharacterized protein with PQ loop repeat